MSETGFFLPVFLFFAIVISSLGWQILIKGVGVVDNLWAFGLLFSTVFMLTASIVTYFPFSGNAFFISILIFMNLTTLYVYSFPKSIWPNMIWFLFIITADFLSSVAFLWSRENCHLAYFLMPALFSFINIPIIVRKVKHLEKVSAKAVLIHVSFISFLAILFPIAAGISSMNFNPLLFLILLTFTVPVTLVLFGISSYLNINTGSGISSINFPFIIFLSIPGTVIIKNMFSLRVTMLNYIDSVHFTFGALLLLFAAVSIAGILISMFSTSIEGFINRNRHFYQKYLTSYRTVIEEVTDPAELFILFDQNIASWFKEFKSVRYIFFNDEFSAGRDISFYEEPSSFNIETTDKKFLHEPYFIKNSVDVPDEITKISSKYKGNIFIPIVYRNEVNGFIAIDSRKFSHSATVCVHNILEMTMNRFEKLSLFTSVIEAEKKIEMLKHFQETGKMVSIIAHELRSPLSSIMFNMEVIKDSVYKKRDADPEYLDISLREIRRLNETVEKMLNYGRTIKLTPSEGEFKSFFTDIDRLFPSTPEKITFIDNTNGERFYFDWDMLKSVMINMISNSLQAIEGSNGIGNITVKCFKRRNRIIIEISDTGPGIPKEIRNSIFEPFFTTRKEGNGLGLATSEKIIKLSGGSVILKETSEKGTVFQIVLPVE
ncbi:MAG: ATP-binding protein [bacterium]|jgi:signal transduction histidine kinase|nr:ATP-binding protein [bacterium]